MTGIPGAHRQAPRQRTLSVDQSRRALFGSVREEDWEETVEQALLATGHRFAHFRPARTLNGWRTAMSGSPGFPDIVCFSAEGVLKVLELKRLRGRLAAEQTVWLELFRAADAVTAVLRPGDHAGLQRLLRAGRPSPGSAAQGPSGESDLASRDRHSDRDTAESPAARRRHLEPGVSS